MLEKYNYYNVSNTCYKKCVYLILFKYYKLNKM